MFFVVYSHNRYARPLLKLQSTGKRRSFAILRGVSGRMPLFGRRRATVSPTKAWKPPPAAIGAASASTSGSPEELRDADRGSSGSSGAYPPPPPLMPRESGTLLGHAIDIVGGLASSDLDVVLEAVEELVEMLQSTDRNRVASSCKRLRGGGLLPQLVGCLSHSEVYVVQQVRAACPVARPLWTHRSADSTRISTATSPNPPLSSSLNCTKEGSSDSTRAGSRKEKPHPSADRYGLHNLRHEAYEHGNESASSA